MRFLTETWTREHVLVSDPQVARSVKHYVDTILELEKENKVLISGFIGPMTPLGMFAVHEVESAEALFKRLTALAATPYCHTNIKAIIGLENVGAYLDQYIKGR